MLRRTVSDPEASDIVALPHALGLAANAPEALVEPATAMDLGATLYMPVVQPGVIDILRGARIAGLRSVVLCLEDALHARDVERGLATLVSLLGDLRDDASLPATRPMTVEVFATPPRRRAPVTRRGSRRGPLVFIRPRNLAMARQVAGFDGIHLVDGFVVPKIDLAGLSAWWEVAAMADLRLMPTLESAWVFDPVAMSEFGSALSALDQRHLLALRLGGNDLLGLLGLRRQRGRTVYEGPLSATLSQAVCQLGARGFALTAPVFDIIDDEATLRDEARRDADFGFAAKTAIHPVQISVIESAFAVAREDAVMAERILLPDARAVFRCGGAMAEPATHAGWAKRTLARARSYGVVDA